MVVEPIRGLARLAIVAACAACGGERLESGTLAYTDEVGRIVVHDFGTGDEHTIDASGATDLALSQDRKWLAHREAMQPVQTSLVSFAAVAPQSPAPAPSTPFTWGVGAFSYRDVDGQPYSITSTGAVSRIGSAFVPWVAHSELILFAECTDGSTDERCVQRVAVLYPGGFNPIAMQVPPTQTWPFMVTPRQLLFEKTSATESHLFSIRPDQPGVDLGVADHVDGATGDFLDVIFPRAVVLRGQQLWTVELETGADELVIDLADEPEFVRGSQTLLRDGVLYMTQHALEADGNAHSNRLWLARGGQRIALTDERRECAAPVLSNSRRLAAWTCGDGTYIVSTSEPDERAHSYRRGFVLGFDYIEQGIVVADGGAIAPQARFRLVYLDLDGDEQELGLAVAQGTGAPFAYAQGP